MNVLPALSGSAKGPARAALRALWLLACVLVVLAVPAAHAQQTDGTGGAFQSFDHSVTGFALTGAHAPLSCESCHVGGK